MYAPSFNTPITSGSIQEFKVSASTTSVLLLSSSLHRRVGTSIFNASNASLHLRYAPGPELAPSASLAAFSVKLTSGSYFEFPFAYQGQVHGIWDATGGWAFIIDVSSGE